MEILLKQFPIPGNKFGIDIRNEKRGKNSVFGPNGDNSTLGFNLT
ncbi:hypothetical protein SPHINGO8BC_60714 [Sphingobacterium multivorum]|uniref:Uncharacterized protein n=1 Tax=Sphingobacterium multivorum TaxID=28454 RepID=A0A654DIL8_SPHMU|nr:hypothetical protein SPHINGO8BC_60714 [Sphingobacterium multivorum]